MNRQHDLYRERLPQLTQAKMGRMPKDAGEAAAQSGKGGITRTADERKSTRRE